MEVIEISTPWSRTYFESIELPGIKAKRVSGTLGHIHVELELADGFDGDPEDLCKQYHEICMQQAPAGHEHTLTVSMAPSSI